MISVRPDHILHLLTLTDRRTKTRDENTNKRYVHTRYLCSQQLQYRSAPVCTFALYEVSVSRCTKVALPRKRHINCAFCCPATAEEPTRICPPNWCTKYLRHQLTRQNGQKQMQSL
jgi:hypothetical protein